MIRRFGTLLATLLVFVLGMPLATASVANAASNPTVAEMTIFSDISGVLESGPLGALSGHSWLAFKNTSSSNITVGKLTKIAPGETVTMGLWGNLDEHHGVWYNFEALAVHQNPLSFSTSQAISRNVTAANLRTITKIVSGYDSYPSATLLLRNCASFAVDVWNSVSPWSSDFLLPDGMKTPYNLYSLMIQNGGAQGGTAVDIPWSSRGVWYGNGSKAPIYSTQWNQGKSMLTFDDLALGTSVSTQYKPLGVFFSGTPGPVIAEDGANPTSPVLSPGSGYSGTIDATFYSVRSGKATTASSISFDVGYMNTVSGAKIEWFDSRGALIGSTSTSSFGMVRVSIPDKGVARVHIDTTTDDAGAAIDNFSFTIG